MVCLERTDNYPGNSCSVPGKSQEPGFKKIWFFLHHYDYVQDIDMLNFKNVISHSSVKIDKQNIFFGVSLKK